MGHVSKTPSLLELKSSRSWFVQLAVGIAVSWIRSLTSGHGGGVVSVATNQRNSIPNSSRQFLLKQTVPFRIGDGIDENTETLKTSTNPAIIFGEQMGLGGLGSEIC